MHEISKLAIANCVKQYAYYKSGFESRGSKNKIKNPKSLNDLNFEYPLFQHLKTSIVKVSQEFSQYNNCKPNDRVQIFASEVGIKYLCQTVRWQSDCAFFSEPKSFKQVKPI